MGRHPVGNDAVESVEPFCKCHIAQGRDAQEHLEVDLCCAEACLYEPLAGLAAPI
jgi:hypothetical protein